MSDRTYKALLKTGTAVLTEAGIEEAGLDAWLLLEFLIEKNRAWFFLHQDEIVGDEISTQYLQMIDRRSRHIPLQHITHQGFFMGYEFYVNEHVLVPRQDTEVLVEEALNLIKNIDAPEILDMCTGSGCILLSLLLECKNATGTGVDLSKKALEVASFNRERNELSGRAELVESDLFSSDYFHKKDGKELRKYDILISNPPYIPTKEIEGLMEEVRLHDPVLALDGMEDGLFFYRQITKQAADHMKKGAWLLYEIGHDQGEAVSRLMKEAGFEQIQVKKDLAGLDRVVLGKMPV